MDPSWMKLLVLLSVLLQCRATDSDPDEEGCSGCSATHTQEEIRELRLEQLRNNILAQLGLTELPPPPPEDAGPPPAPDARILEDYEQLSRAAANSEPRCMSGDFYAKPINSFVGILSPVPVEGLVGRYRRSNDEKDVEERNVPEESSTDMEDIILNQYKIMVNFNLPMNLSDVSKANLVLYQESNTIDHPVLDRFQLVEVRTVIDNVRYFVEKKTVDVYESGLQSFDITRAAELWVQEEVSSSVVIEVLVICNSINCSDATSRGNSLAKVSFVQDASNSSKVPRIITVSRNPLEMKEAQARSKRQATVVPSTGDQYCSANDSLCCLQQLDIDFVEDLGITFILKPKTFRANFCNGYCPEVLGTGLLTSQRFEILRNLNSSPTRAVKPCCSGIEYRNLQVIMALYNHETGTYDISPDLLEQVSVTKCRCG